MFPVGGKDGDGCLVLSTDPDRLGVQGGDVAGAEGIVPKGGRGRERREGTLDAHELAIDREGEGLRSRPEARLGGLLFCRHHAPHGCPTCEEGRDEGDGDETYEQGGELWGTSYGGKALIGRPAQPGHQHRVGCLNGLLALGNLAILIPSGAVVRAGRSLTPNGSAIVPVGQQVALRALALIACSR